MLILFLLLLAFHPIHISVCEVKFSQNSKTFQFSQRIFADDLESAINKASNSKIDILKLGKEERDSTLEKYLSDKIGLTVGDKKLKIQFIGSEIEEGVCWAYYESEPYAQAFSAFRIFNIPLFELFDDQSTIIQFESDDDIRNFRLRGEKVEETISLN